MKYTSILILLLLSSYLVLGQRVDIKDFIGAISEHQHGVDFIVHKQIVTCVTNFLPISERIALLQINARPVNVNLIQMYAPTTAYSNGDVDQFYKQIADIIKALPQHDINIIMGDFNAKIGKGRTGEHIGVHSQQDMI
ncbi:hypothetical protein HUJ04_000435 [Dendroctonus ponderosae]|nr:hypothetical protein HUJ04_000435 [Dendroctonus ponderosae]